MYLYQTKKRWSSVTGVFSNQEDAVSFWEQMSPEMREVNEPIKIDTDLHYPFYIVEFVDYPNKTNGFEYLTFEGVEAELRATKLVPGEHVYVYEVSADWYGNPKCLGGGDYMGSLNHWRIDDFFAGIP